MNKYELPVIQPAATGQGCQAPAALPTSGRTLTLAQVQHEYPCDSCNAPCCTYLPLHTFNVTHMREVDHALYLLNFPRIEIGINATGSWGVYYRYPCRFLDRATAHCTIYDSPQRPSICAHYNPYSCWYKQVLGASADESFLRLDRRRLLALVERYTFDENLNIVDYPEWSAALTMLAELPLSTDYQDDLEEDPVFDRWLREAANGPESRPEMRFSYTALNNPCDGCAAFCCKYLVFPQPVPTTRVGLDYLHFALGFPGLEIGVTDEAWYVIVKTTCRHLADESCAIFGTPERPQICRFYDAHACSYVAQFGTTRPHDFMRVRLEQFYSLVEPFGFDENGNITWLPPIGELRQHVENRLRQGANASPWSLIPPVPGSSAQRGAINSGLAD